MINTTHNVHIDGAAIDTEEVMRTFTVDTQDRYSRWVLKPLAVLSIVGVAIASLVAGAVVLALSLALLPLFALSAWAVKNKLSRDILASENATEAHTDTIDSTADSVDVASPDTNDEAHTR